MGHRRARGRTISSASATSFRPRSIYRQARQPRARPRAAHRARGRSADAARLLEAAIPRRRALSRGASGSRRRARACSHTVKRHMLADVPVGAFLSGGVEFGAIAAAMARGLGPAAQAFTIGFPGTSIDETAAAARDRPPCRRRASSSCRSTRPTAGDVLPAVQASFDEPTRPTAAMPIWYLSRLAAEHVKVVLCGEGGGRDFRRLQAPAHRAERGPRGALAARLGAWAGCSTACRPPARRKWNYQLQNARRFRDSARCSERLPALLRGDPDLGARRCAREFTTAASAARTTAPRKL